MKKLFWSMGMAGTITLAVFILLTPSKVSWISSADSKPAGVTASIDSSGFSPAILTVPVGGTITWINKDDVPHTVASTDKVFVSPALDTDEKFKYTFTKPGTYPYYCSVHPRMTAKVVVE